MLFFFVLVFWPISFSLRASGFAIQVLALQGFRCDRRVVMQLLNVAKFRVVWAAPVQLVRWASIGRPAHVARFVTNSLSVHFGAEGVGVPNHWRRHHDRSPLLYLTEVFDLLQYRHAACFSRPFPGRRFS